MIFAKISPELKMVQQSGLFNPEVNYITGSYMTAMATPYPLGATKVNFRVHFGEFETNENNEKTRFKTVHSESIELSSEELASWGTDDTVVLNLIAAKKGTTVVETIESDVDNLF